MKIGLEISSLSFPLSGIQVYIQNFISALHKVDNNNTYCLTSKLQKIKKIKGFNPSPFWFRKFDVFHGFDAFVPLLISSRLISAVIHDVIPLFYEKFSTPSHRKNFENKINKLLRRVDLIITPSEYTRSLVSSLFNFQRIFVIYSGYSASFRKLSSNEVFDFKKKKGLDHFLLYVGVINLRKNITGLITAFKKVKKKFPSLKLVLISSYISRDSYAVEEEIRKYNDDIILLTSVPQQELVYYYNSADIFIFPSFAEGFGLPVLEAMACGTPVIASRATAIPEVGGDAISYFDPYNFDEMAERIIELLEDELKRKRISESGLSRAKEFSWERGAQILISTWEKFIR
jgi:glycosyltransferase involved in cell wall biosynthesis